MAELDDRTARAANERNESKRKTINNGSQRSFGGVLSPAYWEKRRCAFLSLAVFLSRDFGSLSTSRVRNG